MHLIVQAQVIYPALLFFHGLTLEMSMMRYLNVAFLFVSISTSVNVRFTNTSNVPPKSTSYPQNYHKDFFKKSNNHIFATSRRSSKN